MKVQFQRELWSFSPEERATINQHFEQLVQHIHSSAQSFLVAKQKRPKKHCLVQVSLLLREARLWAGLPETSLTVSQRRLAYRMVSKVG